MQAFAVSALIATVALAENYSLAAYSNIYATNDA